MLLNLKDEKDMSPQNMKKLEKMISQENTVLMNHATWCGHCNMFRPEWEQFKQGAGKGVNVVEIESKALDHLKQNNKLYKKVVSKDGSVYFPMIVVFIKKGTKPSEKKMYDGNRNAADLKQYVDINVPKQKVVAKKAVAKKTVVKKPTKMAKVEQNDILGGGSLYGFNNRLTELIKQLKNSM